MIQFKTISELYAAAGVTKRPANEAFDLILFDELGAEVKKMMQPHRRGFCTVIFMQDQKDGQININQKQHTALSDTLLFQGTEHIFSFVRDAAVEGSVLLFHPFFLLPYSENIELNFPFFSVLNQNLFHLNHSEKTAFERLFELLLQERHHAVVVKPLLIALLEKSKQLYATYASEEQFLSKKSLLVRKYKHLINNCFIEHKSVDYYASLLNITPNYLNEVIKTETGRSAKRHISERVLLEAQNLLRYSEMDIAEISHLLQFSEPTHFSKFFKKETGLTPKAFQAKQP